MGEKGIIVIYCIIILVLSLINGNGSYYFIRRLKTYKGRLIFYSLMYVVNSVLFGYSAYEIFIPRGNNGPIPASYDLQFIIIIFILFTISLSNLLGVTGTVILRKIKKNTERKNIL